MHAHWLHRLLVALIFICLCLCAGTFRPLHAQMTATVNSLADDANAHPWDDPNTPNIDESADGVCEDLSGRCTIRAAIEEAANMNVPLNLTVTLTGVINLSNTVGLGSLYPTDGSNIHGNQQTTIRGPGLITSIGIGDSVTIRGLKFSGSQFNLIVQGSGNTIAGNIFGSAGDMSFDAVVVGGSGNTIGGNTPSDRNIITRMGQHGINLAGDHNVVKGNYIGINAQGDTAGNAFGVFIVGVNNVIGGTGAGDRNIISGNRVAGIAVSVPTGTGIATVLGNYIGTDTTGTQKRPNQYGIQVILGSALIGGGSPSEMNVISGNAVGGIETRQENLGVTILGNNIGLDASGTVAVGNFRGIILSPGSFDVLIENNRISRNESYGIEAVGLIGLPSSNHRIRGNQITHNGSSGIMLLGNSHDIIVGSSLTQDFPQNEIQFNGETNGFGAGISVYEQPGGIPRANTFRKNDFLDNHFRGIDAEGDVQDGIRPPTIQNYVDLGNGAATVTVTHHRIGSVIDVYVGERNTGLQYEGRRWLGSGTVIDSNVAFTFPIDACNCTHIVATATDQAENTSAFTTTGFLVGVDEERETKPTRFALENAYPNPFNPTTQIKFEIPHTSNISLKVFDVLGREVSVLAHEKLEAGTYQRTFDAAGLSSGVYYYTFTAEGFVQTKKLLLLR